MYKSKVYRKPITFYIDKRENDVIKQTERRGFEN